MTELRLLRTYGLVALMVFTGACQCKNPNVKERLKPEGVECADDGECETGLCDALPNEARKCIKKCTSGCLDNEICEPLAQDRYACVPDKAALCSECQTDADCPYPADKCVTLGGANVCARDCSFDAKCPDSFQCGNGVDADGSLVSAQCTPKSGTCECTAASDGQTVPCEASNNFGTCTGVKTCSASTGYGACDARTPAQEVCNGVDDDCNGQTDENLGETACGIGACMKVVANCANGEPQQCVPSMPSAEVCDEVDNDCDTVVDNGFDKQNDVKNCGTCGNDCGAQLTAAQPHGSAACSSGACALQCNAGYASCDNVYANGCETNTDSDMQNCGGCFLVCNPQNANATCDMGVCNGTCLPGYANCDNNWANGCEINTQTDVNNCGACNNICSAAHASSSCVTGGCQFTCDTDWWDVDGNAANGCEYNCVFQSATDYPDLGFVDANCDGIDGEAANAVFVAPIVSGGNDLNPGTRTQPKATIAGGMSAAIATGKRDVYLATGTYVEQASITAAGKGLYGAYQTGTWARANTNVVTVTGVNTPLFIDNANGARVQLITFIGANAIGPSATAYGAFIRNSSNVTLTGLTVKAGSGTNGASGTTAVPGANGGNGQNGQPGCENSGGTCNSCPRPLGGAGGASSCGRQGGPGGSAGNGPNSGNAGSGGTGGTPGGPGTPPGMCKVNSTTFCSSAGYLNCGSGITAGAAYQGGNGSHGAAGSPGTAATPFGTMTTAGYGASLATNGTDGTHGNGGGGGGGGGGGEICCDSYGAGGGGGGGAGCGGQGGRHGDSGGASIGIFMWASSVTADATVVISSNGGTGGNGSDGALGGVGGLGGGTAYGGVGNQDDGSPGGGGGLGGNGGQGGAGGAGAGGPTVGVVRAGTSSWNPVNGTTISLGLAGAGGTSQAGAGPAGLKTSVWP